MRGRGPSSHVLRPLRTPGSEAKHHRGCWSRRNPVNEPCRDADVVRSGRSARATTCSSLTLRSESESCRRIGLFLVLRSREQRASGKARRAYRPTGTGEENRDQPTRMSRAVSIAYRVFGAVQRVERTDVRRQMLCSSLHRSRLTSVK